MKKFRTVEISDPAYENDNLRFITVKTPNLKGRGDVCLFVPPDLDTQKSHPVVMLLHGVYGSAWCWALKAGVHVTAMEMIRQGQIPPMFIAMPSDGLWGDGSGYLHHKQCDFEKWIAEDVPELLQQHIAGISNDSDFFISGLSMGGFGALRIGAKYGQKFKAISAHSAITSLQQMELFVEEDLDHYRQQHAGDEDVLATILQNQDSLPPLYFDCGETDLLIEYNRRLHRDLTDKNIPHTYKEFEGSHEWPYWKKHISYSLRFFAAHVSL
jgi:enterochelin esterase-like enzyme